MQRRADRLQDGVFTLGAVGDRRLPSPAAYLQCRANISCGGCSPFRRAPITTIRAIGRQPPRHTSILMASRQGQGSKALQRGCGGLGLMAGFAAGPPQVPRRTSTIADGSTVSRHVTSAGLAALGRSSRRSSPCRAPQWRQLPLAAGGRMCPDGAAPCSTSDPTPVLL